jgi:hypothetical protein
VGNGSEDGNHALRWQNILAAIATAAGSAAWVSAVGSGVMGARLKNAGMPVESVLALMPTEQRFAIGVGHLLAPLFVGLVGFLADLALTTHMAGQKPFADGAGQDPCADGARPDRSGIWGVLARGLRDVFNPSTFLASSRRQWSAATITLGALVGALLLEPPSLWLYLLQIGAILFALTVVYIFGPEGGQGPTERGAVFLLVLVLAGLIAFAFEGAGDAEFDFAAVGFKESGQPPVAGYYVTTTSNAVLLITLDGQGDDNQCPRSESLGRITALPHDQIERVWIGPTKVKYDLAYYCRQKRVALSAIVG